MPDTNTPAQQLEQRLLLTSTAATVILAVVGVAVGLWSGARAIVFDGMFNVVDAAMTLTAVGAARLIARGADSRFQYGYWHLEPLLGFVNGALLLFACLYGLVDGIGALLEGGRTVHFGAGVGYAGIVAVLSCAVGLWIHRNSRNLGSALLDLDARAWLLGAALSGGLCLSFAAAAALSGTSAARFAALADPLVLVILSVGMAPFPLATLLSAGRQILQVAPPELDARVRRVSSETAARHGFVDHRSYVTRIGRVSFVEVGFVAPPDGPARALGDLDTIRDEIEQALGGGAPETWLTIHFTADPRWL